MGGENTTNPTHHMNRRNVLTALSSAAVTSLAGCSSSGSSNSEPDTPDEPGQATSKNGDNPGTETTTTSEPPAYTKDTGSIPHSLTNAANTHYNEEFAGPSVDATTAWTADTSHDTNVVVKNGITYTLNPDVRLKAYTADGTKNWEAEFDVKYGPYVFDDVVVAVGEQQIVGVNVDDGSRAFISTPEFNDGSAAPRPEPFHKEGNKLFLLAQTSLSDSAIFTFDVEQQSLVNESTKFTKIGQPTVGGGKAFIPVDQGLSALLRAIDLESGEKAWTLEIPGDLALNEYRDT
ncbi:PQQ-binding-like beta-propeller repeat protein [Halomicrococcus sp. NG-SE-24]|uniref:outer membrane protein assembly factor BamB family protein n=1 Tax=Halomicrococcus sp. NG-SE-24 TaxID=3436928 RepID=UPI003D99B06B